ncbi:MAG: class IV adenylate cyclase [Spirochaetales bacterium]|nr:class IV adenylate cyclase [Spirochaetales bacterium]
MYEVELKARVDNLVDVERRLSTFATFVRSVDKTDEYWHGPGWRSERGTKGFRLRRDGKRSVVTLKSKSVSEGIETNLETEFEVSDANAFRALVKRLSCEPYYSKQKTGVTYEYDSCTIELVSVDGLGSFIEIECLLQSNDSFLVRDAKARLRSILAKSGVSESSIEERGYAELILGDSQR